MQRIRICNCNNVKSFVQFENLSKVHIYIQLMEELFSAIETGSVDKVKEVIASPTACSEVSSTVSMYCS